MDYRRLGHSNLEVSRLWLGGMSLGSPSLRPWVPDVKTSRALIESAFKAGINVIDTADAYTRGEGEQVIGDTLHDMGIRDQFVIATKSGLSLTKTKWSNQYGYSRKYIIQQCEAALKRLRTDRIDIYQTHIWNDQSSVEEVADVFDTLIAQGKVLYAGVTDMPTWQIAKWFYRSQYLGRSKLVSTQQHYNAIWREPERSAVPLCNAEKIAFVSYSPLGRGFLCGAERGTVREKTDELIPRMYNRPADNAVQAAVGRAAEREGVTRAVMSLGWVLAQPHVTAAVVGPTSVSQLEELVANVGRVPAKESLSEISAAYQMRAEAGHG